MIEWAGVVDVLCCFFFFKQKTAYEIRLSLVGSEMCIRDSTNTFFRTVMEGDYISLESVQGAFQLRYFKNNIGELDNLIAESLMQQGIEGEDSSDIHGQTKKYPIGTVAKVDYRGKHYYFLAINDVNKFGKPENQDYTNAVSYTHLRAHETKANLVCRLLLEKKKNKLE